MRQGKSRSLAFVSIYNFPEIVAHPMECETEDSPLPSLDSPLPPPPTKTSLSLSLIPFPSPVLFPAAVTF